MAYAGPKFIEQVFGFLVAVGKFAQKALVVLPVEIKGDKAKKQGQAQEN